MSDAATPGAASAEGFDAAAFVTGLTVHDIPAGLRLRPGVTLDDRPRFLAYLREALREGQTDDLFRRIAADDARDLALALTATAADAP